MRSTAAKVRDSASSRHAPRRRLGLPGRHNSDLAGSDMTDFPWMNDVRLEHYVPAPA